MKRKKFVQNDNNYCICYYRYSSHSQNERSIDQQRELAEQYAENRGLTIVKEYVDEAISGTDDERPNYRIMLNEIGRIKPSVLILYKIDRLARDKYELAVAKQKIKDAGCAIEFVAEPNLDPNDPMSVIVEGLNDAMAEFYSLNLSQAVTRGLMDNARLCYSNGHVMLGYKSVGTAHKTIELDEDTAPIVLRIFNQYANGTPLKVIVDDLNSQGIKTAKGGVFNINGLRHILKNRAYIGEYHYKDITIPDGIPRIVSDELYEAVQERFALNRHKSKPIATESSENVSEPRFWLTGKLFCGECKESMQGISGTSKTGKIHYYYACKNHRRHKCKLKNIRKDVIEACVLNVLREFLADSEKLMSLAVDVSEYCKRTYSDDSYLKSLKAELKKTEKELKNIVDAIKAGCFNQIIQDTLNELEQRKDALEHAIETEKVKLSLAYDDQSVKHYFEMYADADFEDEQTRNMIFEYFIDKIYVFEDKLIIDMYYSDDHKSVDFSSFMAYYEATEGVRLNDGQLHAKIA